MRHVVALSDRDKTRAGQHPESDDVVVVEDVNRSRLFSLLRARRDLPTAWQRSPHLIRYSGDDPAHVAIISIPVAISHFMVADSDTPDDQTLRFRYLIFSSVRVAWSAIIAISGVPKSMREQNQSTGVEPSTTMV